MVLQSTPSSIAFARATCICFSLCLADAFSSYSMHTSLGSCGLVLTLALSLLLAPSYSIQISFGAFLSSKCVVACSSIFVPPHLSLMAILPSKTFCVLFGAAYSFVAWATCLLLHVALYMPSQDTDFSQPL
ncbi:unnamed protein product [Protopolystoma xenopodis]|uniref:Uncharacterized protein n=1 Tax=Protopolystoma xenopodis TaxID=117903 RepID=A0A3S5FGU3_9PLAT|nr:unnamed protein product [Protopolystoma xenopodis]